MVDRIKLQTIAASVMLALTGGMAFAADAPIPEKRMVFTQDVDFYGGDLRSIFDTSLDKCVSACLRDDQCTALTFNERQGACFLKDGFEKTTPFEGAWSGRVIAASTAQIGRATAQSGMLDMLPNNALTKARRYAANIGMRYPVNDRDAAYLASVAGESDTAQGALVALTDAPDAWLDLSRELRAQNPDGYYERLQIAENATSAAINGFLRAENAAVQATALNVLAEALENQDRGAEMIPVLKLSENLSSRRETREALKQARERYGFRVTGHQVDSDAENPRLCVNFSEAIAPATDFEPFVRVLGKDLPVDGEDQQICVDGLQHGERYKVILRSGLPAAAGGEKLLKPITIETYVRDRKPSISFASRAYILPRSAEAALPITTVNVDEVALRIHRVNDRNLLRAVQQDFLGASLDQYREDNALNDLGEQVWEGVGEVSRKLNENVVTRLPLGEAVTEFEAGVYVATAREIDSEKPWEDAATQWFVVTDLGLSTTLADDGLHVFVRGLGDAQTIEGVTLRLLSRNNTVLGKVETDAAGYAMFAPGLTRGNSGLAPAMLTAEREAGDFAFLDLSRPGFDLADRGVEGRAAPGPVDVFLTTERGAYRPGEQVHTTILARDQRADAVEDLPLTLIVTRPDGVEALRRTAQDAGAGGRAVSFDLSDKAMRGSWRVRVHADPEQSALASESFLVEDFLPQRIDFELAGPEGAVRLGDAPAIKIDADYLYGSPAAAMAVEGEAVVKSVRSLAAHPGFIFGAHDEQKESWVRSLEPGFETDDAGLASVPMLLPDAVETSRPLTLNAVIRLRDGSARPVERVLSLPLQADGDRIGVKTVFEGAVRTGEKAQFEVIAVDGSGARVALDDVYWTLSKVRTRYNWYRLDGRWNYETTTRRERLANGDLTVGDNGVATLETPVDWGRYELKLVSKNDPDIITSILFTAGWYAPVVGSATPDTLEVSVDKDAYAMGDIAKLRLDARYAGEVFVQVVGNGLIATKTETVEAGETYINLDVTEDWGAGAYVIATLLRPMDVAAKRNPARAIGLSWVPVDPGARDLDMTFTGPDESAPRGPLDGSVKFAGLAAGETAYVTVAAVDVGVLNVTGFDAPQPEDWYFGQRRLGADFRDVYGRLINGLDGAQGRLRSGGDGFAAANAAPPPIEDLVAYFSGVVTADADGVAEVSFDIPDFNGTVRLMAVGWTAKGVGSASKDVLVRDPIVVSASAPRFLAPDDVSRVLIEVAHAFGETGDVSVALSADGQLTLADAGQTFTLAEGEKKTLEIPVTANAVGDPEIRLVTTMPDGRVLTKVLRLPVRANDPVIARQNRIPLAAGGSFTVNASMFEGLRAGSGRATLVIGPLAEFDTAGLLNQLDLYPYGCTEQTTSRAMPLLYYSEVASTLGLVSAGGGVKTRIEGAIARILGNQSGTGGFGLWGPSSGDLWLDSYVTDFLSRAKAEGFEVPARAFEAAMDNLRNRVAYAGDFERGGEDLAYALMVLAREGEASIGDLRYYADAKGESLSTPLAQAQLGSALALYGEQRRADDLFRLAGAGVDLENRRRGWRTDYGSNLRDAAGVLALSASAGSEAVDSAALVKRLSDGYAAKRYTSTQEKVWALLAANALLKDDAALDGVTINGAPLRGAVVEMLEGDAVGADPVVITNDGDTTTSAMLTTFGVPTEPEPAGGNGYTITRTYYTLEGEEISPNAVPQNTRMVVVLRVEAERGRASARLMVDDALPAGFEIDNPSLLRAGATASLDWLPETVNAEHAEFRSDRFLAAVTGAQNFSLAYIVRAISPGVFHHPAALVEDMYRPEFRARTGTGRVTVR